MEGENIITEGQYLIVYPQGYKVQAERVLSELKSCNQYLEKKGVFSLKYIDTYNIRLFLPQLDSQTMSTPYGIIYLVVPSVAEDNSEICEDPVLTHELVHFKTEYSNERKLFKEGLAEFLVKDMGDMNKEKSLICNEDSYTKLGSINSFCPNQQCGFSKLGDISFNAKSIDQFEVGIPKIILTTIGDLTITLLTGNVFSVEIKDQEYYFSDSRWSFIGEGYYFLEEHNIIIFAWKVKGVIYLSFFNTTDMNSAKSCAPTCFKEISEPYDQSDYQDYYYTGFCFFKQFEKKYKLSVIDTYLKQLEENMDTLKAFCLDDFLLNAGIKEKYDYMNKTFIPKKKLNCYFPRFTNVDGFGKIASES